MSKRFYVIVPFYIYENPQKAGLITSIKSIFGSSKQLVKIDEKALETYRVQITQRSDLVIDGLIGLGIKAKIMEKDEITNLFYGLYNPGRKITKPNA